VINKEIPDFLQEKLKVRSIPTGLQLKQIIVTQSCRLHYVESEVRSCIVQVPFFLYGLTPPHSLMSSRQLYACVLCKFGAGESWAAGVKNAYSFSAAVTHSDACSAVDVATQTPYSLRRCPFAQSHCQTPFLVWPTLQKFCLHIQKCIPSSPSVSTPDDAMLAIAAQVSSTLLNPSTSLEAPTVSVPLKSPALLSPSPVEYKNAHLEQAVSESGLLLSAIGPVVLKLGDLAVKWMESELTKPKPKRYNKDCSLAGSHMLLLQFLKKLVLPSEFMISLGRTESTLHRFLDADNEQYVASVSVRIPEGSLASETSEVLQSRATLAKSIALLQICLKKEEWPPQVHALAGDSSSDCDLISAVTNELVHLVLLCGGWTPQLHQSLVLQFQALEQVLSSLLMRPLTPEQLSQTWTQQAATFYTPFLYLLTHIFFAVTDYCAKVPADPCTLPLFTLSIQLILRFMPTTKSMFQLAREKQSTAPSHRFVEELLECLILVQYAPKSLVSEEQGALCWSIVGHLNGLTSIPCSRMVHLQCILAFLYAAKNWKSQRLELRLATAELRIAQMKQEAIAKSAQRRSVDGHSKRIRADQSSMERVSKRIATQRPCGATHVHELPQLICSFKLRDPEELSSQGALGTTGVAVTFGSHAASAAIHASNSRRSSCSASESDSTSTSTQSSSSTTLQVVVYKQGYHFGGSDSLHRAEGIALNTLCSGVSSHYLPKYFGQTTLYTAVARKPDATLPHEVFAMEYIPGLSLEYVFEQAASSVARQVCFKQLLNRLKLCLQLARALKHIHEHKMAHCDVKAGNIVICSPAILRMMVHDGLLPKRIQALREQVYKESGDKSSRRGKAASAVAVSPEEANAVLGVDTYCKSKTSPLEAASLPELDVAGVRLVLLDFNLCRTIKTGPGIRIRAGRYAGKEFPGTSIYTWRHWFIDTTMYRELQCDTVDDGFHVDSFAAGLVMMDILRGESIDSCNWGTGDRKERCEVRASFTAGVNIGSEQLKRGELPSVALFFQQHGELNEVVYII